MTDQEIIYKAISEVVNTDKPAEFAAHNSTCYTIAKYVCEELRKQLNSISSKQPSEDLEAEIDRYFKDDKWFSTPLGDIARHFAQWQKEQMLKSAIDGCYIKRNKYNKENVLNGLSVTCDAIQKFSDGDNVKVIIVKEDKQ